MVSYADFVTLLFAFFTTLYAISRVDADKLKSVTSSMHQAFESTNSIGSRAGQPVARRSRQPGSAAQAHGDPNDVEVRARLMERLASEMKDGRVSLDVDSRGIVISMLDSGSFGAGSAELTAEARDVLSSVSQTVADLDTQVRVEGHTDDVPIHTSRYASNWELSTARATSVVAYLIGTGLPASRLSASGYGEFHPRVPNDSVENRTRNRRVDLVILNATTRAEEPAGSSSPTSQRGSRDARP